MPDAYSQLVKHSGYLVYRKTQIDFIDTNERWTEAEMHAIEPCIMHYVGGGKRFGFEGLNDKRHRQIEIRIATAYLDLEEELKLYPLPCMQTEWFKYRIDQERKARAAGTTTATN